MSKVAFGRLASALRFFFAHASVDAPVPGSLRCKAYRSRTLFTAIAVTGVFLASALPLSAGTVTLNFEGFADSMILTNQYPGLTFSNAITLSSGISLNEFEFPPHSGVNVVSDDGGPITIDFANLITGFSGYFTYSEALTIQAFNAADSLVASASSPFSNNMALSGDPGSSPNELLSVTFDGGISSITVTGDPDGGSFVMDDVTITSGASGTSSPEPASLLLLSCGTLAFAIVRKNKK